MVISVRKIRGAFRALDDPPTPSKGSSLVIRSGNLFKHELITSVACQLDIKGEGEGHAL